MAERLIGPGTIIRSAICALAVVGGTATLLEGKSERNDYQNRLSLQRTKISHDVDNEFPIPAGDIEEARKVVSELTNRVNLALKAGNVQGAQQTLETNEEQFTVASKLVGATESNQLRKLAREEKVKDEMQDDLEKSAYKITGGFVVAVPSALVGVLWPMETLLSRRSKKPELPIQETTTTA